MLSDNISKKINSLAVEIKLLPKYQIYKEIPEKDGMDSIVSALLIFHSK